MTISLHIAIRTLRLRRSKRAVIDGLDLDVEGADRLAILGPSGIGKSTLLQAIAGLAPIDAGTIAIGGRPITGPAASVTMMLQRPALLPWASVLDNVLLGLRFSGDLARDPAAGRRHAIGLIERVGLADRLSAKPVELSGGEQQRVALARALAPRPSVLLLDEPFSALDPHTRADLRGYVTRLADDHAITLVLVTHDRADAIALCRRIVGLDGRPARVVSDERLDAAKHAQPSPDPLATAA